jgi:hypothetical protein
MKVSEMIAEQLNGNINKLTWGDILYYVKVWGAIGDGVKDDTATVQATIDYAISVGGKAVFFPHGTYKVTALTGLSSVVLFGDNAVFSGVNYPINQLGGGVFSTKSSLSYYVSPAGSDNNDGTVGKPFQSIAKAISVIPQEINHDVFILVNPGTYPEDVFLTGFTGRGTLQLLGGGSVAAAQNYIVNKIHYKFNTLQVYVKGFTATTTTDIAILAGYNPGYSEMHWCRCVAPSASFRGIGNYYSPYVLMNECEISNRSIGIYTAGGNTWGLSHSGTGNVVGLYAEKIGTYGKNGTQPGGTTPEGFGFGGSIISA